MSANWELLSGDRAIPYAMAGTLAPYLTSRFSQFLFQFTISHSLTALLFQIIARICTCVNTIYVFARIFFARGENCESRQNVIFDRIPRESEHPSGGESYGRGWKPSSTPHCKPPPSLSLCTLRILHGTLVWLAAFAWCEISLWRTSRA